MTQNKRERGVAAAESGTARHTLRLHAVWSRREMNHSGSGACGIFLVPVLRRRTSTLLEGRSKRACMHCGFVLVPAADLGGLKTRPENGLDFGAPGE